MTVTAATYRLGVWQSRGLSTGFVVVVEGWRGTPLTPRLTLRVGVKDSGCHVPFWGVGLAVVKAGGKTVKMDEAQTLNKDKEENKHLYHEGKSSGKIL